jgi:hypothetical protein
MSSIITEGYGEAQLIVTMGYGEAEEVTQGDIAWIEFVSKTRHAGDMDEEID